jgi:hypothetical protein
MAHIDIVDRIKAITEGLGWVFTYGVVDVKNLIEASQSAELTPEEIHFLLLPVNRSLESNQYGKATTLNYDLAFSIFTPDQFDSIEEGEAKEYYWQKFNYKVRPLIQALYYFQAHLVCPGIVLNIRRINEVYNDGTENLTGVFAEASASIDLDFDFGKLTPQPPLPPVNVFCELLVQCPAWISLEARVTALEQGGGGGLTCAELINCEVIQQILGQLETLAEAVQAATETANAAAQDAAQALALAGTAVQPGDLASVATSGAYGDLSGTPAIPAAQIQSDWTQANNAALDFIKNKPTIPTAVSQLTNDLGFISIAALAPVAYFDGSAGHTGNTTETIVQVIPIHPSQWIAVTRYMLNFRQERTGATINFRVYINTANTLNGNQFLLALAINSSNSAQFSRTIWKNGTIFKAANAVTTLTDTVNVAVLNSATVDTSVQTYLILTVENGSNAATSAFTNLYFGL